MDMTSQQYDLSVLPCKEISSFEEVTANTIVSFLGVVIQCNQSMIKVEFDNNHVMLKNTSHLVNLLLGRFGRFFALFDEISQGEILAFTPFSTKQAKKYTQIKILEKGYHG
ncbi:MAG: hypothetical protein ACW98K_10725 [Candidatus Kariarchaeaceae archaeon]|jgi:hypothetical protein